LSDWKRLEEILETMDIPKFRVPMTNPNARWLSRNMAVRNSEHPDFEEAKELLKQIMKRVNKR